VFLPGYRHYLETAASLQWDETSIDLARDAAVWPQLEHSRREQLLTLIAGFCVGEASVAAEIEPFAAAAGDPVAAGCFRAQARDEARHARFFDRVAVEVAVPDVSEAERRALLRARLEPAFLDVFERRLPAAARGLAASSRSLSSAVALYHLMLEGVVFTAGQLALLDLLERDDALPGLRAGVELVLRDERWHIGFGARSLELLQPGAAVLGELRDTAESLVEAWGDAVSPALKQRVAALHRRRLSAAGLKS
jgi:ribonucleoside-diphosphate reductase beta chain